MPYRRRQYRRAYLRRAPIITISFSHFASRYRDASKMTPHSLPTHADDALRQRRRCGVRWHHGGRGQDDFAASRRFRGARMRPASRRATISRRSLGARASTRGRHAARDAARYDSFYRCFLPWRPDAHVLYRQRLRTRAAISAGLILFLLAFNISKRLRRMPPCLAR